MIYLDNSATTYPKPECVYEVVDKVARKAFNAGRGSYKESKKAYNIIKEARETIASFVNETEEKVVFTSSATEALNMIINGINLNEEDNVYVSPFEHNAVIRTLYAKKIKINIIPFDKKTWEVNIKELENMFAINKPKAVFVSQVSNVTGFEPNYEEIFKLSKKYECLNILDAAQGFGIVKINKLNIDYIVFAGHKSLYGVFGTGGFIKLSDKDLMPYKFGGTGSDSLNPEMPIDAPSRFEAGSENLISIAAVSEGAKWIKTQDIEKREKELTNYLIDKLEENGKIKIFVPSSKEVLGVVSFAIEGYESDDVASILDDEFDICVRSGYHCAPYVHDFIGSKNYKGTVRVSIGAFTKKEDLDSLIKALKTF